MPVKSVIDVEVNDKAFTAFYEKFSQYKQELSELPVLWGESDTALKETANALTDMVKAMTDLSKTNKVVVDGQSRVRLEVEKTNYSMVRLVATTGKFANFIKDATFSLMKWASLTSVFTGLAGYFSFGGLMNLGQAASGRRSEAMGLGIQPGELKAINTTYSTRVPGASRLLSSLADIKADRQQWWKLHRFGISNEEIATKSAAELFPSYIEGAQRIAKRTPEGNLAAQLFNPGTMSGTGFDITTLRQVRDLGPEVTELNRNYRQNLLTFNESSKEDKLWSDFIERISKSWERMNTDLTKVLAPLAGPVSNVVDAFTHLANVIFTDENFKAGINQFANFIEEIAKDLKKEGVKNALSEAIKEIGEFAHHVATISKWIWNHTPDFIKNPEGVNKSADEMQRMMEGGGMPESSPGDENFNIWDRKNWIPNLNPDLYNTNPEGGPYGDLLHKSAYRGRRGGLISAIMRAESGGNPNATSSAGAMGLMQLMPGTYADLRKNRPDLNLGSNPYDPVDNMKAGTAYIQQMLGMFGNDPEKALAAYNWGPGNLQKDIAAHGSRWRQYLPRETSQYVARVLGSSGGGNGGYSSVDVNLYVHQEAGSNTIINANQLKTRTTTRGVSA